MRLLFDQRASERRAGRAVDAWVKLVSKRVALRGHAGAQRAFTTHRIEFAGLVLPQPLARERCFGAAAVDHSEPPQSTEPPLGAIAREEYVAVT